MAYLGGLTRRQIDWIDEQAEARRTPVNALCSCGAADCGHSPNCAFILAEEAQYDDLVEALREEVPDDDELYEIQCESAEAAWFEEAAYGRD